MDSARSQIIEDLKRHLPAPVRRALGTARRTLAETTERIAFELSPDVVARSPALDAEISRFMSENDVPASLNVDVSKYDLMYQYWGRAGRDTQYMNYLRSGFKHASLIGRLIEYKFQSGERIESILDFASGYGRVARFLVQMMAPHRVFVADIKADAVAFQKKHLGVNGFVSPEKPHDLSISQRFDVIAVFSLFSHLPEETFNAWLEKLIGLLKPAGVLLFTTHGIEHMPAHLKKDTQSDFVYLAENEEQVLHTKGRALSTSTYGTTFASECYVKESIERISGASLTYVRFPSARTQDVYLVSSDLTGCGDLDLYW